MLQPAFSSALRPAEAAVPDEITASIEDGVLTVTVPKKTGPKKAGRKIKVAAKK